MGLNETELNDLCGENVKMLQGRVLATVGELTANGDYVRGTVRCVHWGDPHGYTIERLFVDMTPEGRIEYWVHCGEAWFEGTALKVFEMVVARGMD